MSVKTARRYLEQLVADNVLRRVDDGGTTRYCVDRLMATYREVARLQREHDREALTESLAEMRTRISEWESTYGVESPAALRASVGDCDDPTEIAARREAASEWEHLADRVRVLQTALSEYDLADAHDGRSG